MSSKQAECPASMCPLIAPQGSPWTGEKDRECPEHDDIENKGCPWFSMACGVGGIHFEVEQAKENKGHAFVLGPNQPKVLNGNAKQYDCPKEDECSWQKHVKHESNLCGPRYALSLGLDPRVCLF